MPPQLELLPASVLMVPVPPLLVLDDRMPADGDSGHSSDTTTVDTTKAMSAGAASVGAVCPAAATVIPLDAPMPAGCNGDTAATLPLLGVGISGNGDGVIHALGPPLGLPKKRSDALVQQPSHPAHGFAGAKMDLRLEPFYYAGEVPVLLAVTTATIPSRNPSASSRNQPDAKLWRSTTTCGG